MMVKTYRNKILPYEATKDGGRGQYRLWKIDSKNPRIKTSHGTGTDYSQEGKIIERYTVIDAELIENSQDREEVVETDWIDDAYNEFFDDDITINSWKTKKEWREAIEKHAPKQFTPADFSIAIEKLNTKNYFEVKNFLKAFNLLSSDNYLLITQGTQNQLKTNM